VVEAVVIVVGIISLLSVATLRQGFAGAGGANAASLVLVGKALVAIHNWTFLFGPNLALGPNTVRTAARRRRNQGLAVYGHQRRPRALCCEQASTGDSR